MACEFCILYTVDVKKTFPKSFTVPPFNGVYRCTVSGGTRSVASVHVRNSATREARGKKSRRGTFGGESDGSFCVQLVL